MTIPEDQAATIELKPCPHCGGKASQPENYGDHPHYPGRFINCSKCGASVYRANLACGEHDINLIAAWNTRTEAATIAELREMVEAGAIRMGQLADAERRATSRLAADVLEAAEKWAKGGYLDGDCNALMVTVAAWRAGSAPECQHEWTDARNKYIESGEICLKCNAIRAGNQ